MYECASKSYGSMSCPLQDWLEMEASNRPFSDNACSVAQVIASCHLYCKWLIWGFTTATMSWRALGKQKYVCISFSNVHSHHSFFAPHFAHISMFHCCVCLYAEVWVSPIWFAVMLWPVSNRNYVDIRETYFMFSFHFILRSLRYLHIPERHCSREMLFLCKNTQNV